jgi:hypothetical protein
MDGCCYNPRMLDLFRDLEEKLLRQETRNSPGEVATLLHPDFFEFGGSGTVWNRQQTIDRLAQEHPMERSLTDLSVGSLAADVTLVTYRAVGRDLASGNEWHSLRSSIWKLRDGRWQVIFHQGTPSSAAIAQKSGFLGVPVAHSSHPCSLRCAPLPHATKSARALGSVWR